MEEQETKIPLDELISLAMNCLEVGVTILDPQGTLLYYNSYATKVLDRKPEYIGTDIHYHHRQPGTNQKFDLMLQKFSEGRTEPFYYEAQPYGQIILVKVAPIRKSGKFVGCAHFVCLKETIRPQSEQS